MAIAARFVEANDFRPGASPEAPLQLELLVTVRVPEPGRAVKPETDRCLLAEGLTGLQDIASAVTRP